MSNILENYSDTNNFWEYNPQYKVIQPFKKLFVSDKSKSKKDSSNFMWAIALVYHPLSELYYMSDKETKVFTQKIKIKAADVDKFIDKNKEIIEEFIQGATTQAQKSLISWETRLKQRDSFLSKQEYHFEYVDAEGITHKDNTKPLDDMNSKTGKFYEEFFKIQKELLIEEAKNDKKGYNSSDVNV